MRRTPKSETTAVVDEEAMPRRRQLLSTAAAAELLGLTPAQFRRLADRLSLAPEDYYTNPHCRSGPECPLWAPEPVLALVGGAEVGAVLGRVANLKAAKQQKPTKRRLAFQRRYPDRRTALRPAAEALFSLNRYAKWPKCKREHREEIYGLKNAFVEILCRSGLVSAAKLHVVEREGLRCRRCDGEDDCDNCGGTGWFRPPGALVFVAFRFEVDGQSYSWHQPRELVTWPFTLTDDAEKWEAEPEAKPINLTAAKFADAKALIRYALTAD